MIAFCVGSLISTPLFHLNTKQPSACADNASAARAHTARLRRNENKFSPTKKIDLQTFRFLNGIVAQLTYQYHACLRCHSENGSGTILDRTCPLILQTPC